MPTPAERRALLFVAAVAALGTAVRGVRSLRQDAVPVGDRAALADQIARVDSAIATGGRRSVRSREGAVAPAPPGGAAARSAPARTPKPDPLVALRDAPLDLDRADVVALDLLPGIGPALAARIVADRDALGPFGSLDSLQRVKGVGPALAARIAPYVTFSTSGRHSPMGPPANRAPQRP